MMPALTFPRDSFFSNNVLEQCCFGHVLGGPLPASTLRDFWTPKSHGGADARLGSARNTPRTITPLPFKCLNIWIPIIIIKLRGGGLLMMGLG